MDMLRDGARTALRRGMPNALFVVAAIEQLPSELNQRADVVTVSFPWGSLLCGLVCADEALLEPLARLAKPGAHVRALLSVGPRDRASGLAAVDPSTLAANAAAYARAGFVLETCRAATSKEIDTSGSSWAKRLGRSRSVVALALRRM